MKRQHHATPQKHQDIFINKIYRMEFQYCQNPDDDVPIILVDKHIGNDADAGQGIMAEQYVREILWLDQMGKTKIDIWINSIGGQVMEGMAMYNANLNCKTRVDTVVVGVAASIAAVLAQSGYCRYVMDNALEMFHNPFNPDAESNEQSDSLNKMRTSIITMICQRSGLSETVVGSIMNATTWMDSSEMMNKKMCDEVINSGSLNTDKPQTTQNVFAAWKTASKLVNKLINDKKIIKMSKVANKLNLNPEASEDAILAEIDKIENASKHYSKKMEDMQKKCDELTDALKEHKEKMKALEDKIAAKDAAEEEAKAEAKAKEEAEAKDKAENYANAAIKAGKIAASAKEVTVKNLIKDFEGTKEMIDAIPVNGKAVKIENASKNTAVATGGIGMEGRPTSAMTLMAEILNKDTKTKY